MMVALVGSERVTAERGLQRRTDYSCPQCRQPVILHARLDGWVVPHFKHKAKSQCPNGRGETKEHRAAKVLIKNHYESRGYEVILEHSIGSRRADVFVPGINTAFEVEFSQKETREIVAKCKEYDKHSVKSLWIVRQRNIHSSSVKVGADLKINTSPATQLLCKTSKHRPKGSHLAFFVCDQDGIVVFRGSLSSYMLYNDGNEFMGIDGYEYPAKRYELIKVKELFRKIGSAEGSARPDLESE